MAGGRYIYDKRNGNSVHIGDEGELNVVVHPHPPINESVFPLPFSQFFTDTGADNGDRDLRVDGSVNAVNFYIKARTDFDLFIKSITVQISDPGARLDRFGALPALTNGVKFFYFEKKIGEVIVSEAIKTNLDFFRDATGGKNFGDGTGAWKADIAGGGGEDTYFPELNLTERFGLQWGVRLVKGTEDRIVFQVRDDLSTGLSTFNIKAYGIRI